MTSQEASHSLTFPSIDCFDELVDGYASSWDRGEAISAVAWLTSVPERWSHRVFVLDVALEEYCRRRQAGVSLDRELFCRDFREYASDVAAMLALEDACDAEVQARSHACFPKVGEVYHNFEIIEHLAQGGMAQVYLAREPDESGNRLCVLKVSSRRTPEASILGRLEHPRIGEFRVVQGEASTDLQLLTMPYRGRMTLLDVIQLKRDSQRVNGESILQFARQKSPTAPNVLDRDRPWPASTDFITALVGLLCEVAQALEHAHARQVVHGDVKPANVLITFSGHALLIDFNLAFDGTSAIYRLGGTPAYVAPEVLALVDECTDFTNVRPAAAADIYAWGIVAWELFTGQLSTPTSSSRQRPHLSRQIEAHHARQRTFCESTLLQCGVDPLLSRLILRCLAISPERRPNAQELVAILEKWNTRRASWKRWLRRHRRLVAFVVAFLVLGIASTFGWLLVQPPRHVRELAAARQALTLGHASDAAIHASQALIYSPRSVDARLLQAEVFIAQGNPEAAAERYQELASEVSAEFLPQIQARLGYCRALQKDYKSASPLLQKAIDGGLRDSWVLHNLGVVLCRQTKFAEAADMLTEAIRNAPTQSLSYLCRADCISYSYSNPDVETLRTARDDVDKSMELGSPHADHYLILALLWDRSADAQLRTSNVEANLAKALALGMDPKSAVVKQLMKKHKIQLPENARSKSSPHYSPLFRFLTPPPAIL